MDSSLKNSSRKRVKRAIRVRSKIRGSAEKPRLCFIKGNRNLSAQLIDDESGLTLGSVASFSKEWKATETARKNKDVAKKLGLRLAEIAKGKQIEKIVFDRGASKYHGIVAAFADGAREGGLQF
ncbi:MAG: 50S ribosomal protein L18 [Parachlamydiales bacterium]|nr:50S ribosomal protein L18 [Parachlamydiales bacterium]